MKRPTFVKYLYPVFGSRMRHNFCRQWSSQRDWASSNKWPQKSAKYSLPSQINLGADDIIAKNRNDLCCCGYIRTSAVALPVTILEHGWGAEARTEL